MKSKFTITVETELNPISVEGDEENTNIGEQIEQELHSAIEMWVRQYLTEEGLYEAIINNNIMDFDVTPVEGFDELSDYGTIKVSLLKGEGKNVETETLVDVVGEKQTTAEVIETEQPIPDMQPDEEGVEEEEYDNEEESTTKKDGKDEEEDDVS